MKQESARHLEEMHWEETIDFLTRDMPADGIDISELATRYREYIDTMEEFDLEVPAKAVRIMSALLNMKSAIVLDYEDDRIEEEPEENPMDFEEDEEEEEVDLGEPPDLEMPVRTRQKRRIHKNELKDALRDALEVKDRREERQEDRREMEEQFEFDGERLQDKINSLYNSLHSMISGSDDKVEFNQLLEQRTSEEKIEKFMHILSLEDDKKVRTIQDKFLGDLHVKPEEDEPAAE